MSPTYVRCLHCGWVCRRRRDAVAPIHAAMFCTLLSNLHCIIVVGDAEQLAIAVGEEIPKKFTVHSNRLATFFIVSTFSAGDAFLLHLP